MTVGLLSLGASSVINLAVAKTVLNINPDFAFQNFAKSLGVQGSGSVFQTQLTPDGYPTGPVNPGYGSAVSMPTTLMAPSVTWVLSWQGTGGIQIGNGIANGPTNFIFTVIGAGTTAAGQSTAPVTTTNVTALNGTNGYVEFTNGSGATQFNLQFAQFGIVYDGTMTNLQLYRKSDQNVAQTGTKGTFTSEFTSNILALNPKVLRFMDWGQTNGNNTVQFSYRKALSAFSYANPTWLINGASAIWGGATSGTDTYTCSAPTNWPGLVDGATIQVQFVNTNTSTTPTLNVASSGAITIQTNFGGALSAGTIAANCCATLVYRSWLNVWLLDTSVPSANNVSGGLNNGVPIETMVALCNQLGCHMWYCVPFHYSNASVTAAATYIANNLNSNLTCYVEFSNEVWNFGFGFPQTQIADAFGAFLGFPSSSGQQHDSYYGLRLCQIMPLVKTAWGSRSLSTLKRVAAVHFDDPSPAGEVQPIRLNGGNLDTTKGFTNYNAQIGVSFNVGSPTFSRPIDNCEVLANAPYYQGALINNGGGYTGYSTLDITNLTGAADNYATGIPANITAAFNFADNDIRQGTVGTQTCTVSGGNTFTVPGSAPANNTPIAFSTTGTIFTGITLTTCYFVIGSSGSTFQVSLTSGGSAVTGISGGTGTQSVGPLAGDTMLWMLNFDYAVTNANGFGWAQIAASYNGARPGGSSNISLECYEGGLQSLAPTTAQCTSLGISTTYGGLGGKIDNLLVGYKNSSFGYQVVQDQFSQLVSTSQGQGVSVVSPSWYRMQGGDQWSLLQPPGDVFSTPYQTFNGVAAFNH